MKPLILTLVCPKATTCAVELNLLTVAKTGIIAYYLPQPAEECAKVYEALARLTNTLPHHLLILGGGLQGG